MSGFGPDALNIEDSLNASYPTGGFKEDWPFTLNDFTLTSGLPLNATAGITPYFAAVQNNLLAIRWEQNATAGVLVQTKIPAMYDQTTDSLVLVATFRQSGASTANLAMNVNGRIITPGKVDRPIADDFSPVAANVTVGDGAVTAFSAARGRRLTAHDFGTAQTNILDYAFDLSFNTPTRLASLGDIGRVKPGSILQLTITPSAALASLCFVDMLGAVLRVQRNASVNPRAVRDDASRF